MAGYFRKLQGYVYSGDHTAAEPLANGVFAELSAGGVVKATGTKDTKLRVQEKTTMFGLPALVLDVVSVGNDDVFFVESELPNLNGEEWDEALYELPVGQHVRMKRALPGEQVIMTVENALFGTVNVGDVVAPAAGGAVA